MPATIRRSVQNSNIYRAYGILSRHRYFTAYPAGTALKRKWLS